MVSLGIKTVVTPGTLVPLSATSQPVNSINFQPVKSVAPYVDNTGVVYVCRAIGTNGAVGGRGNLTSIIYALQKGQPAASVQPKSRIALTDDLINYGIDGDTAADGLLISYE